jgi:SAM-dependent methyltransferase
MAPPLIEWQAAVAGVDTLSDEGRSGRRGMAKAAPFDAHHQRYDAWFDKHGAAYVSELLALRPFVPFEGRGLEIGVGSGRFAAPLGVQVGVDPSPAMLAYAVARGIDVVVATAEQLPFAESSFDFATVVTTLCFVDSPERMLSEARRVLQPDGRLVIGFIDRASDMGREYEARKADSVFYRDASFHSADEVEGLLESSGFSIQDWAQTLTRPLAETTDIEPLRLGRGRGAFVVVSARSDKASGEPL